MSLRLISPSGRALEAGGLILLAGGVGAGKSLWLRRLAGLEPLPEGAALRLDGEGPPFLPMRVFLREERQPPVWLAPTLIEELTFGLAAPPARVREALATWGLDGLDADLPLERLNRVQALSLFLAAADLAGARLTLLDEPLAGFPPQEAGAMAARIAAWAQGRIVVVASNRWQDWTPGAQPDARIVCWRVTAPDACPIPAPLPWEDD